jgi:hypothetical protein
MVVMMQIAYWYRLRCVPLPSQRSNLIVSHLFLFLGRLAFIFGGSLFGVVFFRHLPEIKPIFGSCPDVGCNSWRRCSRCSA